MTPDKIPDEIMRIAHGLYADAQQRHNVTDIARALMDRDKRAAEIASCGYPDNEPGRYAHGRLDAATAILTYGGRDDQR